MPSNPQREESASFTLRNWSPRTDVMYVVTEYGMVNLKGKSVPERAKALIGIAHPDFRDGLAREAREKNQVPKGYL